SLDPRAQQVRDLLDDASSDENRVQVVRTLDSLNTFSGFINRTRRRDIGNFTTRKPETVEVEFSDDQRMVYDDLVDLCRRMARQQAPGQPVEFLISTLQRQAASCINGLGPLVNDILQRRLTSEEISEADGDDETQPGTELLELFRTEIDAVVAATHALGDDDPKFDALRTIVEQKQTMENNKLLLFSTFRHTLAYLQRRLATDELRLGVVHGNVPDADRRELRRRFKLPREDPRALDLLLSSEVGTEGLDYQFCDALVNYDLPWNPMRVEQRIGRIDRRGQRSETVAIINLITPGTVDASIYHRCLYRIGVFQSALGGSEAILGELTREMRSIADNLSLSQAERDDRLRQLADNKLGRLQELQKLEDEQAHLFGLAVKGTDDTAVHEATSPWLTPTSIAHLVRGYLNTIDPGRQIALAEDRIAVLRPSQTARELLLRAAEDIRETNHNDSRWLRWLKGTEPTRRLVVTASLAEDDPEIEVLGPAHPLVRAAAQAARLEGVPTTSLLARSDALEPGRYPFAIFGWTHLGLRDDFSIRVFSAADPVDEVVTSLLGQATDFNATATMGESDRDSIDRRHYAAWADARAEHVLATQVSLDARLASLRTTHTARTSLITEQLAGANEDRIRRMREGQLRNADIDFQRREAALLQAVSRADLLAEPLCYGVLEVQAP
ncbi:MAG: helicase, partial [Actinobacteria bacterium]|nr:helicase [Actinomycetota bacterium]